MLQPGSDAETFRDLINHNTEYLRRGGNRKVVMDLKVKSKYVKNTIELVENLGDVSDDYVMSLERYDEQGTIIAHIGATTNILARGSVEVIFNPIEEGTDKVFDAFSETIQGGRRITGYISHALQFVDDYSDIDTSEMVSRLGQVNDKLGQLQTDLDSTQARIEETYTTAKEWIAQESSDGFVDFTRAMIDVANGNKYQQTYISARKNQQTVKHNVHMSQETDKNLREGNLAIDPDNNEITSVELSQRPNPNAEIPVPTLRPASLALESGKEIQEHNSGLAPTPRLKPNAQIKASNGEEQEAFEFVEGDANEIVNTVTEGQCELSQEDIDVLLSPSGNTYSVVGTVAHVRGKGEASSDIDVSAQRFFSMLADRAIGFNQFATNVVLGTIQASGDYVIGESPRLISQIVAGIIQGRDLDEITEQLAAQVVSAGAVEVLFQELGETDTFSFMKNWQTDHVASMSVVKDALTGVAVTAILSGRDAGLEDYAQAALSAGVQRVITRGIDNFFVNNKVSKLVDGKVIRAPIHSGVSAAVVHIASSVIAGEGITKRTLRGAATAGGIAYASSALVGYMSLGAAAGPAGIVVGAVLGVVVGNLFKSGGEKVYHSETVNDFKVLKEDGSGYIIIGVRETGATLRAGITQDDLVGTDADDIAIGNDLRNEIATKGGNDMVDAKGHDDYINTDEGDNYVEAGSGDDFHEDGSGNTRVFLGDGNDISLLGDGNDIASGGKGNDSLEGQGGHDQCSGGSGNDALLGGEGNDTLLCDEGDDFADGGKGDDYIEGGDGIDELRGAEGNDTLDAGPDADNIDAGPGDDLAFGGEGPDLIKGGIGNDILYGEGGPDILYGGFHGDILVGGDGHDFLYGEFGPDYIVGGEGNDLLNGGMDSDVYIFGRGDGHDVIEDEHGELDIVRLAHYSEDEIRLTARGDDLLISSFDSTDSVLIKNQLSDQSIERVMLSDGRTIDMTTLSFTDEQVPVYSFSGDNISHLIDQTSYPGTWQQHANIYAQTEYNPYSSWYVRNYHTARTTDPLELEYINAVQVRTKVVKKKSWHGRTRHSYHHSDYREVNLQGTPGSDRMIGNHWDESFLMFDGPDFGYGNGGVDTIDAGNGPDFVVGGPGSDIISLGYGHDLCYGSMGDDDIDAGPGNDAVYGDWGDDIIKLGPGDDFAFSGEGNDTVYCGDGNDEADLGDGNDTAYTESGNNLVRMGNGDDLGVGGAGIDIFDGGKGNDTLRSGAGPDINFGGDGADYIDAGEGDDFAQGGPGPDTLIGGLGNDTVSYDDSNQGVHVDLASQTAHGGYAEGDTIDGFEHVITTDYNDTVIGDSNDNHFQTGYGNDSLSAAEGNDTLQPGAGIDTVDGGSGIDTVSYEDSTLGVEVNLATGQGRFGFAAGDTYTSIEGVIGSRHDDKFILGPESSNVDGGDGYDTAKFPGNSQDYFIILEHDEFHLEHRTTGSVYVANHIETLSFDDGEINKANFPGLGNGLMVTPNDAEPVNGIVALPNNNLSFSIDNSAQYGDINLNADGTYTYIPNINFLGGENYFGPDSFSIRIQDQESGLVRIQHVEVQRNVDQETREIELVNFQNQYDIVNFDDGSFLLVQKRRDCDPSCNDDHERISTISTYYYDKNYNLFSPVQTHDIISATMQVQSGSLSGELVEQPRIIKLADDQVALAWVRTVQDGQTINVSVEQQKLSRLGAPVSSVSELIPGSERATNISMTALAQGGYVLTYEKRESNPIHIGVRRHDSNGNPGGEVLIATNSHGTLQPKTIAFDDGTILVAWLERVHRFELFAVTVSPTNEISKPFLLTPPSNDYAGVRELDSRYYDIEMLSADRFAVVYLGDVSYKDPVKDHRALVQIFDRQGDVFNREFLEFQPRIPKNNYFEVHIKRVSDDHFTVAASYDDAANSVSRDDIFLQLFNFDGQKVGLPQLASADQEGNQNGPFKIFPDKFGNIRLFYRGVTPALVTKYIHHLSTVTGSIGHDVQKNSHKGAGKLLSSPGADVLIGAENKNKADFGDSGPRVNPNSIEEMDHVDYSDSSAGIMVNMTQPTVSDPLGRSYFQAHGGHAEGDRLRQVGGFIGSRYNDTFISPITNLTFYGNDSFDRFVTHNDLLEHDVIFDGVEITVGLNSVPGTVDRLRSVESFQFGDTLFSIDDFPEGENSFIRALANTTINASFSDNSAAQYELYQQPSYGRVDMSANGNFFYTTDEVFQGQDSFRYYKINGLGLKRVLTVNTLVANSNPIQSQTQSVCRVNAATDALMHFPSLDVFDGKVIVSWGQAKTYLGTINGGEYTDGTKDGAYVRLFDINCNSLSPDVKVDPLFNRGGARYTAPISLPDHSHMVVWQASGSPYTGGESTSIITQRIAENGFLQGNFTTISAGHRYEQRTPDGILLNDNKLLYVWSHQDGTGNSQSFYIKGRLFDLLTSTLSDEIIISLNTAGAVSGNDAGQGVSACALSEGGFAVAYEAHSNPNDEGYGIYLKKFDSDGNELLSTVNINTSTIGDQRRPIITEIGQHIVVIWYDYQRLTNSPETVLRAQIFDKSLTRIGNEMTLTQPFIANNDSTQSGHIDRVNLLNMDENQWLLCWSNDDSIRGMVLDNALKPLSSEMLLHREIGGQIGLHDARIHDGRLVVAYEARDIFNARIDIEMQTISIQRPFIAGGKGPDVLAGSDEDNVLEGHEGNNYYMTGAGKDIVKLAINPGAIERVTDFDVSHDRIDLSAYDHAINGFSDLLRMMSQSGDDCIITFANEHQIILENVSKQNLTSTNFLGRAAGNSKPSIQLAPLATTVNQTLQVELMPHVSDLDNDVLSINLVPTNSTLGSATITNGTLTYQPDENFVGNDEVTLSISDGQGDAIEKTIQIAVHQPQQVPPVLVSNSFVVNGLDPVNITTSELSITDSDTPTHDLYLGVYRVSGGYFARSTNQTQALWSFSYDELTQGGIQFIPSHNQTEAVNYQLSVSDTVSTVLSEVINATRIPVNYPPVITRNNLTITENESTFITSDNLFATDRNNSNLTFIVDYEDSGTGYFVHVNHPGQILYEFSQEDVQEQRIMFSHLGSEITPALSIRVSDGSLVSEPSTSTVTYHPKNDRPLISVNQIEIREAQTVLLTRNNLSALDPDNEPSQLRYSVSDVQQGYFAYHENPEQAILDFTQQEVDDELIIFRHDGSETPPFYSLVLSDGELQSEFSNVTVTEFVSVNDVPLIIKNSLTINEGERKVLEPADLMVLDEDSSDLTWTIEQQSHIIFVNQQAQQDPLLSFKQSELERGEILVIHDGSESAPSYTLSVSDGITNSLSSVASITFDHVNDVLSLELGVLNVSQGAAVNISTSIINAVDDNSSSDIVFIVEVSSGGQFETANSPNQPISSFTHQQILDEEIIFRHDNSEDEPVIRISATDGEFHVNPTSLPVEYVNRPDQPSLIRHTIPVTEGGRVAVDTSMLSAFDPDTDDASVRFTVVALNSGWQFESIHSPGESILQFTQEQVANDEISFVHLGGDILPQLAIRLSDGTSEITPAQPVIIDYTKMNDLPIVQIADFTVIEGETVLLNEAQLRAIDEDHIASEILYHVEASAENRGQFELVSEPEKPIFDFTQQQINNREIQFRHDGSEIAPKISFTVRDLNIDSSVDHDMTITLINKNDIPVFRKLSLTVSQGQTVTLRASDFSVSDNDSKNHELIFIIAGLFVSDPSKDSYFEYSSEPGVPIFEFSQQEILDGQVSFVHRGSEKPNFQVKVSDGTDETLLTYVEVFYTPGESLNPTPSDSTVPTSSTSSPVDAPSEHSHTPSTSSAARVTPFWEGISRLFSPQYESTIPSHKPSPISQSKTGSVTSEPFKTAHDAHSQKQDDSTSVWSPISLDVVNSNLSLALCFTHIVKRVYHHLTAPHSDEDPEPALKQHTKRIALLRVERELLRLESQLAAKINHTNSAAYSWAIEAYTDLMCSYDKLCGRYTVTQGDIDEFRLDILHLREEFYSEYYADKINTNLTKLEQYLQPKMLPALTLFNERNIEVIANFRSILDTEPLSSRTLRRISSKIDSICCRAINSNESSRHALFKLNKVMKRTQEEVKSEMALYDWLSVTENNDVSPSPMTMRPLLAQDRISNLTSPGFRMQIGSGTQ